MLPSNLGVVFGPTLMRPAEESVAGIMDIKHQNEIVELLIINFSQVERVASIFCLFLKRILSKDFHRVTATFWKSKADAR